MSLSTVPEGIEPRRLARWRLGRRVFASVLVGFLLAGLAGALGVRSAEVTGEGGGYRLTVTYAAMSRAGLATPWQVDIRRPGGFDGPVRVATTNAYFDLFDENGFRPDPSSVTASGTEVVWEFDPPPGDVLTVAFDARVEPGRHTGASAVTSVLDGDQPVVSVEYTTRIMP